MKLAIDKIAHFSVSYGIADVVASAVLITMLYVGVDIHNPLDVILAALSGFLSNYLCACWKEYRYDASGKGIVDKWDLIWSAVGGLISMVRFTVVAFVLLSF